jgi:hypothetical protein
MQDLRRQIHAAERSLLDGPGYVTVGGSYECVHVRGAERRGSSQHCTNGYVIHCLTG